MQGGKRRGGGKEFKMPAIIVLGVIMGVLAGFVILTWDQPDMTLRQFLDALLWRFQSG